MQALFRNPIVEPGLVGTSSGAAFGSALFFVLGGVLNLGSGMWSLPAAACLGGVISTCLVFLLARSREDGRASIVTLLLTGLAVNALFMSAIGFLSYIARDPQARSITFWSLGTLSGASWRAVVVVAVATAFTGVISFVGLVVPHILRMLGGADNRYLIVGSALTGATLLSLAELIARLTLRPAELPIGIVTSAVGVPVFLLLLRRRQYVF